MRRQLGFGALAGMAGGLALAIVLLILGEGPIGQAVGLERQSGPGPVPGEEMFSRGTQQLGGAVGALVYGIALGAIFAVAFVAFRHWSTGDDWRASVQLAAVGFLTIFLIPFLKYPPNPPAVGSPDTIGRRTVLFLVMVGWSVVSTWAAALAARWCAERGWPDHLRAGTVVLAYLGVIGLGFVVLPGTPDPVNAPATLVWNFRLSSLAGAAAFWAVTGAVFGWLQVAYAARSRRGAAAATGARVSEPV